MRVFPLWIVLLCTLPETMWLRRIFFSFLLLDINLSKSRGCIESKASLIGAKSVLEPAVIIIKNWCVLVACKFEAFVGYYVIREVTSIQLL